MAARFNAHTSLIMPQVVVAEANDTHCYAYVTYQYNFQSTTAPYNYYYQNRLHVLDLGTFSTPTESSPVSKITWQSDSVSATWDPSGSRRSSGSRWNSATHDEVGWFLV